MYSVEEKCQWIKSHIWKYSPVWFNYGLHDCGTYDPEDVWLENGRIYCRVDKKTVDITYARVRAFAGEDDYTVIEFGKESPVVSKEALRCTATE